MSRRRLVAAVVAVVAGAAAVASAPPEEARYELLESMPGPWFRLSRSVAVVDWLVLVRTTPEVFPPTGAWGEFFEVEIDAEWMGELGPPPTLFVRLARVAPNRTNVLSSTVARASVEPVATVRVADEQGYSPCIEGVCEKLYVVRFVMVGAGVLRTQWFIRAGVDWVGRDATLPEAATMTFDVAPLD